MKTNPPDAIREPASPEQLIDLARRSFRLASEATSADAVAHFADLGRQYLTMAHEEATIQARPIPRRA